MDAPHPAQPTDLRHLPRPSPESPGKEEERMTSYEKRAWRQKNKGIGLTWTRTKQIAKDHHVGEI